MGHINVSNEMYKHEKRPALGSRARHFMSKETYESVKRDL